MSEKPKLQRPIFPPAPGPLKKRTVRLPPAHLMQDQHPVIEWLVQAEKDSQEDRNNMIDSMNYNNTVSGQTNDAIWGHLENGASTLETLQKILNIAKWILALFISILIVSVGEFGATVLNHLTYGH